MNKPTKTSLIWGSILAFLLVAGLKSIIFIQPSIVYLVLSPIFLVSTLVISATIKSLFY